MYYRVIPFERTFDTYGLIYKASGDLAPALKNGQLVKIPFRNTQTFGIVFSEASVENLDYDSSEIKEIDGLVSDFVFLSEGALGVIDFIAKHYITPIHNALSLFFPKNLLEKIKKDTFSKIKLRDYAYNTNISLELSGKQEEVFQSIARDEKNIGKFLLYGVTGSGKTEIYMKLIETNLKEGKQSLLLIPEIILTSQIGERIKQVFGDEVLLLHSGVSAAKKSQYWMDIKSGNAKIIIGTRSSLFYPYKDLSLIIMDEEHDPSYISDNAPRYHSLDVAEYIAKLSGSTLLLGSGTPRVTTMYRALQGEFEMLQLLEKYRKNGEIKEENLRDNSGIVSTVYSEEKFKGRYKTGGNRLKNFNYSQNGVYFITICTAKRLHFFGEINEGIVSYSEYGEIVKENIGTVGDYQEFVSLGNYIIMPNHIHMILYIDNLRGDNSGIVSTKDERRKMLIPKVIGKFKMLCTKGINELRGSQGEQLWQANYHDHIIRNEDELLKIQKYIQNNPLKWKEDKYYEM